MKKIIIILSILFLSFAMSASAGEKKIEWKNYKEGMALSKKTGKNVFIYFHTSWCTYCTKMKNTTFKDKKVIEYINSNYIPIGVDGDKEKDLVKKYRVRGYPDSVFIADGKTFHRPGYVPAKIYYAILSYVKTRSYLKMSFSKFLKQIG